MPGFLRGIQVACHGFLVLGGDLLSFTRCFLLSTVHFSLALSFTAVHVTCHTTMQKLLTVPHFQSPIPSFLSSNKPLGQHSARDERQVDLRREADHQAAVQ